MLFLNESWIARYESKHFEKASGQLKAGADQRRDFNVTPSTGKPPTLRVRALWLISAMRQYCLESEYQFSSARMVLILILM